MRYLIRQRRDKLVDMLSFRYFHSGRVHKEERDGDDGGGYGGEKETGILLAGDGAFNIHIPNENVQQRPWLNITRNF